MLPEIGVSGVIIVLIAALLLFGAKRLPEIGRSLGSGMREFRDAITGRDEHHAPGELPPAEPEQTPTPAASPSERDTV
ncbi:MAG: twin-arginine translocase TatA/TatE family subunit [Gaiellaceae bacterium]